MKRIHFAHAISNGIIFCSNKYPDISTLAYFDDTDEIKTRQVFTDVCEFEDFMRDPPKFVELCQKKNIILIDLLLIFLSTIITILTVNPSFLFSAIYFSIMISSDFLFMLRNILTIKSTNQRNLSKARFHSAEHMILNAYTKLQKIPTLDEVKKFSRFSANCGSRFMLSKIALYTIVSILMAIVHYIGIIPYLVLIGIIIIIFIIDSKTGFLRFLQVLVTSKPTDKELLLAIEGIKQFEITEKELSENPKAIAERIAQEYTDSLSELAELTVVVHVPEE